MTCDIVSGLMSQDNREGTGSFCITAKHSESKSDMFFVKSCAAFNKKLSESKS